MKVGGGLNYVTGPMGAGKSLYGVRRIAEFLGRGQYVISNMDLAEGWSRRLAWRTSPAGSPDKRRRLAELYESLYVHEGDLERAMRYRIPGEGEARALFVWDEGHNDLNNRRWRDEGRDEVIKWATQLRKLGLVGFLLSQHADNTDAALRRVCNFQVRLQNQREQTRIWGFRWTPFPLFLAYWYPANLGATGQRIPPMKVERYFLSWHKHLYDTHALFHGLIAADDSGATELLPEPGKRALTRSVKPGLPEAETGAA